MEEDLWRQYYPTPQDVRMNAKQWRKWSRHVSRVDRVQAMAFDFDGITEDQLEEIRQSFSQLTYLAYSSFSHKSPKKGEKCSCRFIVPLTRSMTPSEYNNTQTRTGFWYKVQEAFPLNDEQTKDPTRLWYLPSFRVERQEHFFVESNCGYALDVDAILEGHRTVKQTRTSPEVNEEDPNDGMSVPSAETDEDIDQGALQNAAGQDTGFGREFVKGKWDVRCHDDILRPFSWIIENWDSLPKQANGNYNCCRPGSHTVGSAFIHTFYNT